MSDGRIEYVDRDYTKTKGIIPSRQIRTRKSSYNKVISSYARFRISLLKHELEHQKNLAVAESHIGSVENIEKNIDSRVRKIAKIEEEIKILSLEDVPKDYVEKRAIKLKKAMMSHLRGYVGLMYMIEPEKKSEIFENVDEPKSSSVIDQIAREVSAEIGDRSLESYQESSYDAGSNEDDTIILEPTNFNFDDVRNRINRGFKSAREKAISPSNGVPSTSIEQALDSEFVNVDDYIYPDDVGRIIDGAFDRLQNDRKNYNGLDEGAVSFSEFVMPYDDRISSVIDEDLIPYIDSLSNIYDETAPGNKITGEISKAIKNCFKPPKNVKSDDNLLKKSIRDEVRNALAHYDSDLKKTVRDPRYNYKPMSDAEIAKAREEMNDSYNTPSITDVFIPVERVKNASSYDVRMPGSALRDEVIVVPERGKTSSKNKTIVDDNSAKNNSQFVGHNTSAAYSLDNLMLLKRKISELENAQDAARKNAIDAEARLQKADNTSRIITDEQVEKYLRLEKALNQQAYELSASINELKKSASLANDAASIAERYNKKQRGINDMLDSEYEALNHGARHK